MRRAIAVTIPEWVQHLKKQQKEGEKALFQVLPVLMQWQSYEFTVNWLLANTVGKSAEHQLQTVLNHMKNMLLKATDTNCLVARISVSAFIHNQFILTIEPKVGDKLSSNLVLRITDNGLIEGIVREYSMN